MGHESRAVVLVPLYKRLRVLPEAIYTYLLRRVVSLKYAVSPLYPFSVKWKHVSTVSGKLPDRVRFSLTYNVINPLSLSHKRRRPSTKQWVGCYCQKLSDSRVVRIVQLRVQEPRYNSASLHKFCILHVVIRSTRTVYSLNNR